MADVGTTERNVGQLFQALAFEERRVLLTILREGHVLDGRGLTITQLAERAATSRFTASRHLGVLRGAGLVEAVREGTKRIHYIDIEAMREVEDWLYQFTELRAALPSRTRVPVQLGHDSRTVL